MADSRLNEKRRLLLEERNQSKTNNERRYVIDLILRGIERDMERLGIAKEEETSNKQNT